MKYSKKLLTILSGVSLGVTGIAPVITSCNSGFDKIVEPLAEEAIKQFKNLTTAAPHYTGDTDNPEEPSLTKIKKYYEDLVVNHLGLSWGHQDDKLVNGKVDYSQDCYQGNCYFDIPATKGHENDPMLILQGHIDIVEDHNIQKLPKFDRHEYIIDLVEDKDKDGRPILHSADYKTTIGGDDGAGVAAMLAIAAKRDEFEHGAIRCLLTTDEETGMYGAVNIPHDEDENWFRVEPTDPDSDLIMNLINIDNEVMNRTPIASAGGIKYDFTIKTLTPDTLATGAKHYTLEADGFKGGHSMYFDRLQVSAINILTTILGDYITADPDTNTIQLSMIDCDYAHNAVPKDALIHFAAVSADASKDITKLINEKLEDIKKNYDEPDAKITLKEITVESDDKFLSTDNSEAMITLLNDWWCGCLVPEDYIRSWCSSNISPVKLFAPKTQEEVKDPTLYRDFTAKTLFRGFDKDMLTIIKNSNQNVVDTFLEKVGADAINPSAGVGSSFDPWLPPENNPLKKVLVDGYSKANINVAQEYGTGGLESSYWFKVQPKLNIAVTGPEVINCHTYNETLYLDTIAPLMQILLYSIQHISETIVE